MSSDLVTQCRTAADELDAMPSNYAAKGLRLDKGAWALREAATRIAHRDAVIAGLVEVVRQMSNQFRVYQHLHEQKQTQDGDEKALRNKEWADLGFAALAKAKESRDD